MQTCDVIMMVAKNERQTKTLDFGKNVIPEVEQKMSRFKVAHYCKIRQTGQIS